MPSTTVKVAMKYEGHITIKLVHDVYSLKYVGEVHKMHHSCISGWDEVESGVNHFLTKHDDDYESLKLSMLKCKEDLEQYGFSVTRLKIEECVFDERY